MEVGPSGIEDRPALEAFLHLNNALRVARRGELVDASDHPAVLAWSGDELVGVATYVVTGEECELLTLYAAGRSGERDPPCWPACRRWRGAPAVPACGW